jgi:ribonuclease HI
MPTPCPGLSNNQCGNEVKWQRPLGQHVKLNTDAACDLKAKKAGIGFVLRNDAGELVGAGSVPIPGNPSVLAIEGLAVFHGLLYCLAEGIQKVELECDAVNVIAALNKEDVNLSVEGCIFDDIKELIPEFEVIKWRKIPRICNQVAHSIARRSLSFAEKRFWKEIGPPWLEESILADIQ